MTTTTANAVLQEAAQLAIAYVQSVRVLLQWLGEFGL
jgi:hypothetical protein